MDAIEYGSEVLVRLVTDPKYNWMKSGLLDYKPKYWCDIRIDHHMADPSTHQIVITLPNGFWVRATVRPGDGDEPNQISDLIFKVSPNDGRSFTDFAYLWHALESLNPTVYPYL